MIYYINTISYPVQKKAYDKIKARLKEKGVKFIEKNLSIDGHNKKLLRYDVRG